MALTRNEQAEYLHWQPQQTKFVDGKWVTFRDVVVHTIHMSDVEDPDLWVADHIWKWQQSEAGKWAMENAVEKPYWTRRVDTWSYGYVYHIVARLSEQNQTFWELKWGGLNK